MLGTNDFQSVHDFNAGHSAQGIASLVRAVKLAPIEPGMPAPRILIVSPPEIREAKGVMAPKFEGARAKCAGLAAAYAAVARELECAFFDAGAVTTTSRIDGVHLDADQHELVGEALAAVEGPLLAS
jgi:lysophospholipase L1-like esterase